MKGLLSSQFIAKLIICILLFFPIGLALGQEKEIGIDSKIILYRCGYDTYWIIVPEEIKKYQYLGYYPLTAFLFANLSQMRLNNLSVQEIRQGSFGYLDSYHIYAFEKIKCMKALAKEIKSLDEFGVAGKKELMVIIDLGMFFLIT